MDTPLDTLRRGVGLGQTVTASDFYIEFAFYSVASISQAATWIPAHTDIATVNASTGAITGVSNGQTTLTVTGGANYTYSFNLVVSPIPISGYEIEYDPESWNNVYVNEEDYITISNRTNCYAYMLNNQVDPLGNYFGCDYVGDNNIDGKMTQQPGEFYSAYMNSGHNVETSTYDIESIIAAVELDFECHNLLMNTAHVFERMDDPMSPCPVGTYKVALALNFGVDYHWYRQNPDGSWSHKQGNTDVKNWDAYGEIIMDPRTANLSPYEDDLAFFYVSAWNHLYVGGTNNMSTISLNQSNYVQQNTQTVDVSALSQIQPGMRIEEVVASIGFSGVNVGSGTIIHRYRSADGIDFYIVYQMDKDNIFRVTRILGGESE